jgi:GH43 family beta-xylosidase
MRQSLLYLLLALSFSACQKNVATGTTPTPLPAPGPAATTFTNPLLASGPDPWVYQKDGTYYFLITTGGDVRIRKTTKMSELATGPIVIAWQPVPNGPNSRDVWAPELHFLDGKWYIYFTAGPGNCCGGQRLWVLENASPDPTQGTWTEKGRIYTQADDYWAIDGTVFEQGGKRYLLWSGQRLNDNTQRLYIAQMSNPWTLTGPRVELSEPTYTWEKYGAVPVNEGPEIIKHGGSTFLLYSASHCGTDFYGLGQLRMSSTADPLVASNWTKSATPVFVQGPNAFGPGHNGFFKSKDGSEDWLIYHANNQAGQGCGDLRNPRMQKFTWNADGSPNFGTPVDINVPLLRPAGE